MSVGLHAVRVAGLDVSCLVDSVSINHGRNDSASQPEASSCTVEFTATPEDPLPAEVDVGAVVVVTTTTGGGVFDRFRGRITDLSLGWDEAGEDTPDQGVGQFVATGVLADLGRRVVGDTPWPQERDGARVAAIMEAAGIPLDPMTSDPGTVDLLPRDVDARAALEVAHAAATSAGGLVWMTRDGEVRYSDADHRRGITASLLLDSCDILVTPTWRRTTEGLTNKVSIGYGVAPEDPEGGESEQPRYVAEHAASIEKWGTYDYSNTTELAAQADAEAMGNLLLTRNSSPVWVMADLPVDVDALDAARYDDLLGLDLHALVALTGLPSLGTAPTSTNLWVEGWAETLTYGGHTMDLVVSGYCRTVPPPHWDDVDPKWLWGGSTTDATPPVEVRRNLITNPSAETDLQGWSHWMGTGGTSAMSRVTTGGVVGAAFVRETWSVAPSGGGGLLWGPFEPVEPGVAYTASAWVRCSHPVRVSMQWQFYLDSTPTTGSGMPGVEIPANVWTRLPGTFVIPADSNQVQPRWYVSGPGLLVGSTFDMDGMLLEAADRMLPYFDGDTPARPGEDYSWAGTPHASESVAMSSDLLRVNECMDPQPIAGTGHNGLSPTIVPAPWNANRKAVRITGLGDTVAYLWTQNAQRTHWAKGTTVTVSATVQMAAGYVYRVYVHDQGGNVYYGGVGTPPFITSTGKPQRVSATYTMDADLDGMLDMAILFYADTSASALPAGVEAFTGDVLIEEAAAALPYFDGGTPSVAGADYDWTGGVNASASVARANAVTRRNDALNPRALAAYGGWGSNNGTYWTSPVKSTPVPEVHPDRITTCAMMETVKVDAGGRTTASLFGIDARANDPVVRGYGVWVYSPRAGDALLYVGDNAQTVTTHVPAHEWTWAVSNVGRGYAITIFNVKPGEVAAVGDRTYWTGCRVTLDAVPVDGYMDGDFANTESAEYAWEGTPGNSPSTETQRTLITGGVPPDMTWDDAACFGPPINHGRWDDQAATLRWDQLDPTATWDNIYAGSV